MTDSISDNLQPANPFQTADDQGFDFSPVNKGPKELQITKLHTEMMG